MSQQPCAFVALLLLVMQLIGAGPVRPPRRWLPLSQVWWLVLLPALQLVLLLVFPLLLLHFLPAHPNPLLLLSTPVSRTYGCCGEQLGKRTCSRAVLALRLRTLNRKYPTRPM